MPGTTGASSPLDKVERDNFNTLLAAAKAGDLALLRASTKDGLPVALLCAVNQANGEFEMVPLAQLIIGSPYEQFIPPT